MTTALLNNAPVEFVPAHYPHTPAVVTVVAPIALSADDVVTLLYQVSDGLTADDLADDADLRHLVADLAVNGSLHELGEARCRVAAIRPGQPGHDTVIYLRRRVAEIFPAVRAARPGWPVPGQPVAVGIVGGE
jgi:hypothetical protein